MTTNRSIQSLEMKDTQAGSHCSFGQGDGLKDLILLDSDSTDTFFETQNMLKISGKLNIIGVGEIWRTTSLQ